jgi:hypothetical protein
MPIISAVAAEKAESSSTRSTEAKAFSPVNINASEFYHYYPAAFVNALNTGKGKLPLVHGLWKRQG